MKGRFLSRREFRRISARLTDMFGAGFPEDLVPYAVREKQDTYDLYLLSPDITLLDVQRLRDVTAGVYAAEVMPGFVRPSVEGSILLARQGAVRILRLPRVLWHCWLLGQDLQDPWLESADDGWWLIGNEQGDVLGAGKKQGDHVKNYLPKQRRLREVH